MTKQEEKIIKYLCERTCFVQSLAKQAEIIFKNFETFEKKS